MGCRLLRIDANQKSRIETWDMIVTRVQPGERKRMRVGRKKRGVRGKGRVRRPAAQGRGGVEIIEHQEGKELHGQGLAPGATTSPAGKSQTFHPIPLNAGTSRTAPSSGTGENAEESQAVSGTRNDCRILSLSVTTAPMKITHRRAG